MEKLRFGIIGYGVQGALYAAILTGTPIPGMPAIPQPENCCLSAIGVRSEAALEKVPNFPGVARFADWHALISSDCCDAVIITTPHFSHPEIAIAALNAGKHVLCEKPAAIRASQAAQMIACAESHSRLSLALILNQRTNPLFRQLKQIVDSGELGTLRRSNWIINSWWRPDSYYSSNPWRGTWEGEGGGVLVNQAPHQLDLWLWLCGKPDTVFAKCIEGAHRNIPVENDVTIVTSCKNGTTGTFITCTHDPLGTDRLELDFSKGKIVVEDSRTATITRFSQDETVWNQTMTQRDMIAAAPESLFHTETLTASAPFGVAYTEVFENFANHIAHGTPLIATGADGLASVQLANAAQLSGWLGQEVPFPCDTEQYDRMLAKRIASEKNACHFW